MSETEFQDVPLSGGKIQFTPEDEGTISIRYSFASPYPLAMFQICASAQGEPLAAVPITGIGPMSPYPQPSLLISMISDRHGLFGKECPACSSYFRTQGMVVPHHCPYCGHTAPSVDFLTRSQLVYVKAFVKSYLLAVEGSSEVILDLDALVQEVPDKRPAWIYSEESQQNRYTCEKCRVHFDILGEYGLCPQCGSDNFWQVFKSKIDHHQETFDTANSSLTNRQERELMWSKLTSCVSDYDALGNDLLRLLLRLPMTPRRRKEVASISFQQILSSAHKMLNLFDIDVLEKLSEADKAFLNRMFHRRHLIVHRAGRVDENYLALTSDTTFRLHQTVRMKSNEVGRLIGLIRGCGQRLIDGYRSITIT